MPLMYMDSRQLLYSMSASIIANKGFVREFATKVDAEGQQYLDAPIISAWGACMSVGQIIGQTTVSFINARFGRKVGLYWLWFVLLTSVLAETLARPRPVHSRLLLLGVPVRSSTTAAVSTVSRRLYSDTSAKSPLFGSGAAS